MESIKEALLDLAKKRGVVLDGKRSCLLHCKWTQCHVDAFKRECGPILPEGRIPFNPREAAKKVFLRSMAAQLGTVEQSNSLLSSLAMNGSGKTFLEALNMCWFREYDDERKIGRAVV